MKIEKSSHGIRLLYHLEHSPFQDFKREVFGRWNFKLYTSESDKHLNAAFFFEFLNMYLGGKGMITDLDASLKTVPTYKFFGLNLNVNSNLEIKDSVNHFLLKGFSYTLQATKKHSEIEYNVFSRFVNSNGLESMIKVLPVNLDRKTTVKGIKSRDAINIPLEFNVILCYINLFLECRIKICYCLHKKRTVQERVAYS